MFRHWTRERNGVRFLLQRSAINKVCFWNNVVPYWFMRRFSTKNGFKMVIPPPPPPGAWVMPPLPPPLVPGLCPPSPWCLGYAPPPYLGAWVGPWSYSCRMAKHHSGCFLNGLPTVVPTHQPTLEGWGAPLNQPIQRVRRLRFRRHYSYKMR